VAHYIAKTKSDYLESLFFRVNLLTSESSNVFIISYIASANNEVHQQHHAYRKVMIQVFLVTMRLQEFFCFGRWTTYFVFFFQSRACITNGTLEHDVPMRVLAPV